MAIQHPFIIIRCRILVSSMASILTLGSLVASAVLTIARLEPRYLFAEGNMPSALSLFISELIGVASMLPEIFFTALVVAYLLIRKRQEKSIGHALKDIESPALEMALGYKKLD